MNFARNFELFFVCRTIEKCRRAGKYLTRSLPCYENFHPVDRPSDICSSELQLRQSHKISSVLRKTTKEKICFVCRKKSNNTFAGKGKFSIISFGGVEGAGTETTSLHFHRHVNLFAPFRLRCCWLNCQRSKLFSETLFLLIYIADSTMQWKSLKANSFQWRQEEKHSGGVRKNAGFKKHVFANLQSFVARKMQIRDI